MDTGTGGTRALGPWVGSWVGAAVCAVAVAVIFAPPPTLDARAVAMLVAMTSVAETLHLRFRWGRTTSDYTFTEVAIVANLLLLPPSAALLVGAAGIAGPQIVRRFQPIKVVFNTSQVTVSSGAAALVLAVFPAVGPIVAGRPVLGVLVGMVVYAVVNLLAVTGLLARVAQQSPTDVIRDHGAMSSAAVLGNAALGVIVAHTWVTQPGLLPLLLAPLVAMQLSYRGAVRSRTLLSQLRAEHERLDRVVLGTSDGILLLDALGHVELWNAALEAMTGIPADDAVGRPVSHVLTRHVRPDDPIRGRWLMDHARTSEPTRVQDATLVHVDGTTRAVRESHTFLFDARGRCVGDVVLIHDVTRQRELERMKGDFVARVSHELRTPLTPIRGFAEVLAKRGDKLTPEQRQEAARSIASRAGAMTSLVEDLLLVARLDGEEAAVTVDPVPTDLAGIVARTVGRFRSEHAAREIHLYGTPGVPAALADPDRAQQVVANIIDNALRYSPDDTPVEIVVDHDADDVIVAVTDRGPGIPLDKQEAIFERFHRLEDPLRMRTSGVGLGLFIARRLCEAMHGSLTVASRPGEGARFTVRLPVAAPASGVGPVPMDDGPGIRSA